MPSFSEPRHRCPAALAAIAVPLLPLGLIAGSDIVSDAERMVFEVFNGLPAGWGLLLLSVMQLGTLLGVLALALVAEFAAKRLLAGELLVAGLSGWLISRVLKVLVARPRPSVLLDDVVIRAGEAGGFGFPSGHVTIAAALATVVAAWLPRRWQAPLWALVIAVAMGRMHVGAHLPLDVVGGALLGALIGGGVRALSHVMLSERSAEQAPE